MVWANGLPMWLSQNCGHVDEGNDMKRVSILVFLMVSLVELDLERYRIYLFLSIAAFAVLVRNALASRRRVQNAMERRTLETTNRESGCLSAEQGALACGPDPAPPEDRSEGVEPAQISLKEEGVSA